MKTDAVLAEMFRVKDNLGEQFAWDARAICADLMVKQRRPHPGFPLVENLSAPLSTHAQRIAGLPPPRTAEASGFILKDEPPRQG